MCTVHYAEQCVSMKVWMLCACMLAAFYAQTMFHEKKMKNIGNTQAMMWFKNKKNRTFPWKSALQLPTQNSTMDHQQAKMQTE